MAAAFIPLDPNRELGRALLLLAHDARSLGARLEAIKSVMDAMTSGSDYSILEAQFGIPVGRGADVAYLIGALKDGLGGVAQFKLLPDWFGQP